VRGLEKVEVVILKGRWEVILEYDNVRVVDSAMGMV